jgi:hypothetical protein
MNLRRDWAEVVFYCISVFVIGVCVVNAATACTATPTPGPDYGATLTAVAYDLDTCNMTLENCQNQPTQTPHVIVVTPVPPTPLPITPTPPYPANLVKCDEAPLGTRMYVTTRTTVRFWHSTGSNNIGQAEAGESGILKDKSKDADADWWWRADGLVTNDHPYGITGWVKAVYAGCVPLPQ